MIGRVRFFLKEKRTTTGEKYVSLKWHQSFTKEKFATKVDVVLSYLFHINSFALIVQSDRYLWRKYKRPKERRCWFKAICFGLTS